MKKLPDPAASSVPASSAASPDTASSPTSSSSSFPSSCSCSCAEVSGEGVAGRVRDLRVGLQSWVDLTGLDDEARLALLGEAEVLTRVLGALSVGVQVDFAASQIEAQAAQGVAVSRRGRAVADDLAEARRTSPYWGSRELTAARALTAEMPCTLAALAAGTVSLAQARAVTEATSCLDPADRAEVDRRLATRLVGVSTKEMVAAARALVYELDPAGYVARARKAARDRGVWTRPAPDVMGVLSARLPAAQAIACYQALRTSAQGLIARGDPRTLNQLMADVLVARLTGREVVDGIDVEVAVVMTDAALFDGAPDAADLAGYGPVPAELVRDLLTPRREHDAGHHDDHAGDDSRDHAGDDAARDEGEASSTGSAEADEPGLCPDGGRCVSAACTLLHAGFVPPSAPPTSWPANSTCTDGDTTGEEDRDGPGAPGEGSGHDNAEDASTGADEGGGHTAGDGPMVSGEARAARVWLRRFFADPLTGQLIARDPRRRLFTGSLRAMLIARGRYCANSWCGAPIRHVDHIERYAQGGDTTAENGRGLCARCNLGREHPRQADPPPEAYLDPPPILDTFLGRPPLDAPAPSLGRPDDDADLAETEQTTPDQELTIPAGADPEVTSGTDPPQSHDDQDDTFPRTT